MIDIEGKYANAKIFTDNVESTAIEQIQNMVNHKITEHTKVSIMPDVHAGKGSTIGTTIKLPENFADWKVCPNVVGVDVGCGIAMYKLSNKEVDLSKLDDTVNKLIPSGFNTHNHMQDEEFTHSLLENLSFNIDSKLANRVHRSLGTLGGGNHFIELGKDEDGNYWLSVHSGSRNLGVQVAQVHQGIAIKLLNDKLNEKKINIREAINELKEDGRQSEIEAMLKDASVNMEKVTKDEEMLAYLTGNLLKDYLADMALAQEYAIKSRKKMLDIISEAMKFEVIDKFDSIHNFIEHDDLKNGTIRKGATSAKKGERLVIPLNMRDGSLICIGKGNEDWNNSAPHGAGRLMSRNKAKDELTMANYVDQMKDIYSSSVSEKTLDEAPDAYKPADVIMENIKPTAEIMHIVKPAYNFKSQ